ncbi:MAG: NAD(P)-dependent oxidoreductase [Polyangiaceae bacterium]|nr:NAD(P)-dependent oxidoreductase [Polyangiaceae bacterium]
MTILVTGASGFLGSHIAEQLSQAGRSVRALVRKTSKTQFLSSLENVELVYGSVDDRESCFAAMDGVEGVIHAAGLVKAKSPEEFLRVNTEGTQNLVEAAEAQEGKVERFVLVSSQAAGGPSNASGDPVRVGEETKPVTGYGRSKLAAEKVLLASSLASVVLRPPAIYGPRDSEILIFFKSVKSGVLPLTNPLEAKYSMIYGPDCAAACIRALDAEVESGSVFYLDDGAPITFKAMIDNVEKALNRRAWLRLPLPQNLVKGAAALTEAYGKISGQAVMLTLDKCNELHAAGWVCDNTDARRALNWEPQVRFPEGVKITGNWYQEQGWL